MGDDESGGLGDLWAEMGQQIESRPVLDPAPANRPAASRQVSPREKLAAAFLNGFLPAWLAIFLGGLMGASQFARVAPEGLNGVAGLPAVAVLFALPLAWLTRPLWLVGRLTLWRCLVLMLLAAGLGQITMWLPYTGLRLLTLKVFELPEAGRMLQRLYEGYLSYATLALYAVAAGALFTYLGRARRSLPWVEAVSKDSMMRTLVAILALGSPLLFLAGSAAIQGRIAPEVLAWSRDFPPIQPSPRNTNNRWSGLYSRVEKKDPAYFSGRSKVPSWSTDYHHGVEEQVLQILKRTRPNGYEAMRVLNALLVRPDELREPLSLAWVQIETVILERQYYRRTEMQTALITVMLPTLAASPLSAKTLVEQRERLDSLESKMLSPEHELDINVYQTVNEYRYYRSRDHVIEPTYILGQPFPISFEAIAHEIEDKQTLTPWLRVRKTLDFHDQSALERSVLQASDQLAADGPLVRRNDLESSVRQAVQSSYTLQARPYLQTVRVVIALRLYKLEHHAYPAGLAELSEQLPDSFALDGWSYTSLGKSATLSRSGETLIDSKKAATWTLL